MNLRETPVLDTHDNEETNGPGSGNGVCVLLRLFSIRITYSATYLLLISLRLDQNCLGPKRY